jgi:hypothetical protein
VRQLFATMAALAVVLAFGLAATSTALANAPVSSPGHELSADRVPHPHHVFTGNGGCVDINAVLFAAADEAGEEEQRGLHRGANASSFNPAGDDLTRGPFHGPCLVD